MNTPQKLHYTSDMVGMRFWLFRESQAKWEVIWITGYDLEYLKFEDWSTGERKTVRLSTQPIMIPCQNRFAATPPIPFTKEWNESEPRDFENDPFRLEHWRGTKATYPDWA